MNNNFTVNVYKDDKLYNSETISIKTAEELLNYIKKYYLEITNNKTLVDKLNNNSNNNNVTNKSYMTADIIEIGTGKEITITYNTVLYIHIGTDMINISKCLLSDYYKEYVEFLNDKFKFSNPTQSIPAQPKKPGRSIFLPIIVLLIILVLGLAAAFGYGLIKI
jgi:hypothetical protein